MTKREIKIANELNDLYKQLGSTYLKGKVGMLVMKAYHDGHADAIDSAAASFDEVVSDVPIQMPVAS